jgi:hypothetical protein
MKTTTITVNSLAAQIEAAEEQARKFRERRAELQADLADLRDRWRGEMRRGLGTGGTSPELKAIRAKVTEAEALVEEADKLIQDADQLVIELHAQRNAAATEEEKATHAADVARLSGEIEQRLTALKTALVAASKTAGELLVALGELNALDGVACTPFIGAARYLDVKSEILAAGWKIGLLGFGDPPEWWVQPLLPPVAGLDQWPEVNIGGYLRVRDSAKAQQSRP